MKRRPWAPAGAVLLWLSLLGSAFGQVQLVTDEEARLPDAGTPATRAITRGPAVVLVSPAEVAARSFALEIRFEPRGGSRLDAESVKVEYLKSPVVDVTPRLKPSLQQGVIAAGALRVPAGSHRFRVSALDTEGRSGSAVIEIRAR